MKIVFISFVLLVLTLVSCEKSNIIDTQSKEPFIFQSLKAEKDTVTAGSTVKIKATAYGYNLEYTWYVSAGDILGAGPQINYVAAICKCGSSKITCLVTDGYGYSDTKSIYIKVEP